MKVYAGRNGRLPKHFVARQKLCLPASVSYWINALGGTPLLCLHQALDPKLIKAIEQDVVPHLLQLGVVPEAAPDLTQPEAGAPALTLVFDREGWSPDLFKRLARRGIACITWHKNFTGEDWPEEDFHPLEVPIHGPAGTEVRKFRLSRVRMSGPLEPYRRGFTAELMVITGTWRPVARRRNGCKRWLKTLLSAATG